MKKRVHYAHYAFLVLPLLGLSPVTTQAAVLARETHEPGANLHLFNSLKQTGVTVTGKITGDNNDGLPGVAIQVKGTSLGTATDIDGNYQLAVPDGNATLVISYVGYTSQEVPVRNRTTINVTMAPDVKALKEVVVVGYGTQNKADVSVAVGSVTGEAIAERGTVNALQGVQGQVAGVDISSGSGRAGANFSVQIRGQNSLANAQPLFVVDGVIVPDINFLNPQDIAKMDVLKDAASTAIYGSRGSNGVVIVTTKQGTGVKGGTSISYDGYTGVRQVARMPDFMDGDQWWEFRQNSFIVPELIAGNNAYPSTIGGAENPAIAQLIADKNYTNWRDQVLQTGRQNNHWITVAGMSENNMQYVIGAGYQNEKGNFVNDNFERYNFKASVDHKISDKWAAGVNFNFSLSEIERGSDLAVTNAFRMAPIFSPYDADGNLVFRPGQIPIPGTTNVTSMTSSVNPLIDNANSVNNTRRYFGVGNLYLQYSPVSWLDLRSTFSPSVSFNRQGRYWGPLTESRGLQAAAAELERRENFSYIMDNIITARKEINEHSFTFTGLHSIQRDQFESNFNRVSGLPFNSSFNNLETATTRERSTSAYSEFSIMSFMARLNYSFHDRYLVTLASRWDGSSKLSTGNKWSSFPSVGLGWRISEENFMQDVSLVSELKARVSLGYAGNNNNVNPYGTQMNLSSPTFYDFGGAVALGYTPNQLPNPGLSWERTREVNAGLDYGILNNRVTGSVDVYNKLSDGLILRRQIALENGYPDVIDNIGSVKNTGVELSLRTVNVSTSKVTWTTTFNFSRNKNEIVELLGGQEDMPGNAWFIGQPINVNYTYIFDGIWQENERDLAEVYRQIPGQAKVVDIDDNQVINNNDRAVIGQKDPKWIGGFSTQLTFMNFDLSASMFGRQGQLVYSPFHAEFVNMGDRGRNKLDVDYYMAPNSVTPTRASNTYPLPGRPGDYWGLVGYYRDASFFKVQNISLGYSLPAPVLERIRVKALRVYANVLNPFVFTKYDGFDPEYADGLDRTTTNVNNNTNGNLNNTGPSTITYQFGVNVKF
ncbi:TonB-dependent receptor [Pontibacter qinzhouensis]|uniref:TonB-dependent receptor n=1 Tax=Pontibacter qinzhouensis TaxID=2603253 RepID=A0A5C8KAK5_9BACT|nr:TonB-dependent receptor [Pontibacter qinzhouensis]TXK48898.1 TonB-dependent receptor [Pontibacter qinzhouensis]